MALPVDVQCAGMVLPRRDTTRTADGLSSAAMKRTDVPSSIPICTVSCSASLSWRRIGAAMRGISILAKTANATPVKAGPGR